MIAYLAATWLGLNAGIAAALTAAYRRHNRHLTERADFDRHVGEALAVACPLTGPWDDYGYGATPEHDAIRDLMADLAELRAVETVEDALYLWGGPAR